MAASIQLIVPGTLRYRAVAVRAVAEAARLVSGSVSLDPDDPFTIDVRHPFDVAVVSAFMEIFNNVAIHAYERRGGGEIEIEIKISERDIIIEVRDHGSAFDLDDIAALPGDLDEATLPEGGMGIHIAKTMLDEITYQPGPPNLWRLCKRFSSATATASAGAGRI